MANPQILPGLLLGAVLPFVFAALTMSVLNSVTASIKAQSSADVVDRNEYIKRIANSGLSSALWHLLVPAAFAIGVTEAVGYLFGTLVLAGFLAGAIVSGLVMATTLTNTGAAMDSSDSSSVFGASLKDAGGPSINVLTKLIAIVTMINTLQVRKLCIVQLFCTSLCGNSRVHSDCCFCFLSLLYSQTGHSSPWYCRFA
jgi:K(+)-stimulated pyrophosphate-energized sodium pump